MATESVIEIIGGLDNGGGINNDANPIDGGTGKIYDADGNEINPLDLLWIDPELGNHIYFGIGTAKVIVGFIMWFVVLNGGRNLTNYMLWAWACGLLSVGIAWIPVMIGYFLLYVDSRTTDTIWLVVSLMSIDGPMIGYVVAIVIVLLGYFQPFNSGLTYTSEWHFWLGMVLGICFDALSITF